MVTLQLHSLQWVDMEDKLWNGIPAVSNQTIFAETHTGLTPFHELFNAIWRLRRPSYIHANSLSRRDRRLSNSNGQALMQS